MQHTPETIYEVVHYSLKGHQPAIDYFMLVRDVLHFWDDLIDRDRPLRDTDINAAMFKVLVLLPQNSFYAEFKDSLTPVLVNAIANWQAANQFERGDDPDQLELAFVIRSDYANILIHCAYLVGGYFWMNEVTPLIRSLWTSENFQAYRENLMAEKAARAASLASLAS